jgi:hypothetical protein
MKKLLFYFLLFVSFNLSAQVPTYVPTNNLVGWWPFEGDANDESVNGINGQLYNVSPDTDRFSNANSSYYFNGTNAYIELPPNTALIGPTNSLTVSAWIKLDLASSGYRAIFTHRNVMEANASNVYGMWVSSTNSLYSEVSGQISSVPFAVTGGTISNSWHHVLLIADDLLMEEKLYIDGMMVASINETIGSIDLTNKLARIGRHRDDPTQYFKGNIDDIGVWSRSLDSCEILDLFNANLNSCTSGINELNSSMVNLFPNPSNGSITLGLAQHMNGRIIVSDILGKELLSSTFDSNEVKVNLNSLQSTGTYFVKVLDHEGNIIAVKKLVYQ